MTTAHEDQLLDSTLTAVLRALHEPALVIDLRTSAILMSNEAAAFLYGKTVGALLGTAAVELRAEPDGAQFRHLCEQLLHQSSHGPLPESTVVHETHRTGAQQMRVSSRLSVLSTGLAPKALMVLRPLGPPATGDEFASLCDLMMPLPVGVVLSTTDLRGPVFLNQAAATLFGLGQAGSHALFDSTRQWKACWPEGSELDEKELPFWGQPEQASTQELLLYPADGSAHRWVSTRTRPVRDRHGQPRAWLTTLVDVGEFPRFEQELREARERAEREARRKGAFYSSLSRELRNPLTSILGYVDLIAEQENPQGERAEWCSLVRKSGDVLMSLIQDLVDLGQMEAGAFTIERAPFSTGLVVAEVLSQMRTRAQRKGLDVVARYTTPVPRTLQWDANRLRQAISTLLTYSIEHTARGDITLQVAVIGTDRGRRLAFDISSLCRGVSQEELDGVFDAFSPTAPGSRAWSLAFPVAIRLAEMMGGTIEGRVDEGRLYFRLTVAPAPGDFDDMLHMNLMSPEQRPASLHPPARLRGRVLVVEDNEDDRMLICKMLERVGLRVDCTSSGLEALQLEVNRFDAVLMDVEMPEVDGLETTRRLRENGVTVPVVALTAAALAGDRERCLDAGCTAYVSKPIDRPMLLRTLDSLISTTEDRRLLSELPAELATVEPLRSSREEDPMVNGLLPVYVARIGRYVDHIARTIQANDRTAAEKAARSLGGTATHYGFEPLSEAADHLAALCHDAQASPEQLRHLLRTVTDIVQRVRVAYPSRPESVPPTTR